MKPQQPWAIPLWQSGVSAYHWLSSGLAPKRSAIRQPRRLEAEGQYRPLAGPAVDQRSGGEDNKNLAFQPILSMTENLPGSDLRFASEK